MAVHNDEVIRGESGDGAFFNGQTGPTVSGSRPGYKGDPTHALEERIKWLLGPISHSWRALEYLVLNDFRCHHEEKSPLVNQPPKPQVPHQVTQQCSPMLMQVIRTMDSVPQAYDAGIPLEFLIHGLLNVDASAPAFRLRLLELIYKS